MFGSTVQVNEKTACAVAEGGMTEAVAESQMGYTSCSSPEPSGGNSKIGHAQQHADALALAHRGAAKAAWVAKDECLAAAEERWKVVETLP